MTKTLTATLILLATCTFAAAAAGGDFDGRNIAGDFTLRCRMFIDDPDGPQPSAHIGSTEIALRPMEKAKPKDPTRLSFVVGGDESNRAKTALYPGKWYHVAFVGRGGKLELFVNGFRDGATFTAPSPTGALKPAPLDGVTTTIEDADLTDSAASPEQILADFKANLAPARKILTVAHRGVHKHAPENTRVSYVQAVAAGAPIVEFDTALTSDGHIVGMHDKTVDRTTNGTGKLAEMTLEQVRKLEAGSWKAPKYEGEPVPTLDEVADVVRGKSILMLDLKAEGQGAAIARWLETTKYPHDQVIIAPWEDHEAVALRKHVPMTVPMIRLTSKVPTETADDAYFEKMKSIGLSGFSVNWQHLTEDFTRAAQKHGMKVYTWTLNDPPDIAGAALLGVDGVITDDSAATITLLADLAKK